MIVYIMPFNCYLCEKESVYLTWFCEDCRKIKNIMNVYGKKELLEILETTCLRDKTQIGYKIDNIVKKVAFKPIHDAIVEQKPTMQNKDGKMILRPKKNLS